MVTNESRMGGNDLESNLAYYGAESGMEKLTADLSALYTQYQGPDQRPDSGSGQFSPTAGHGQRNELLHETITYPPMPSGNPASTFNTVSSGSNQGLYAEIIPMTLQVIATRPAGASVNVTRKVEVALIPVFQFGVFCGYDCSYFPGPNFGFGGRVHTNQNLFLATGDNLVFNDKLSAFQQIVMDQLENGWRPRPTMAGRFMFPRLRGLPLNGVSRPRERTVSLFRPLERFPAMPVGAAVIPQLPEPPNQLPQHFVWNPEWFRHQLDDGRQEHAVALCAELLHQQPAALAPIRFRLSANRSPASRRPARWEPRGCTTRRKSASFWPTRK